MTAASVALLIGVSALSACVNGISAQAGRWKWRFASKLTASALKMGVSEPFRHMLCSVKKVVMIHHVRFWGNYRSSHCVGR